MYVSSAVTRRFASGLAPCLLALAPLACGADDAGEPADDRAVVKISFDETAYVDATLSTGRIVERVRHETESIFLALRKAELTLLTSRHVDLPLDRLEREPVTVVDPGTGETRSALRVRYHYAGLAQLPKGRRVSDRLGLGVLHTAEGPQASRVLAECTASGERQAAAEPWTVFDASLPGCVQAMAREHAAIDAARKRLSHPEREIVPLELHRVTLPVVVRVRPWGTKEVAGDTPKPSASASAGVIPVVHDAPEEKLRSPAIPGAPGAAPGDGNVDPLAMWDTRETEKDYEVDREDEEELRRVSRGFSLGAGVPPPTAEYYGSYTFLAPNYALLYVAIVAGLLLLFGQRRRSRR